MPRKVTILENRWAMIANDDEITVGQRERLQRSIADSITATYSLTTIARKKVVELDSLMTDADREFEKQLPDDERLAIEQLRANTAELLALRELPDDEQRKIVAHQRIRILCYLRGWDSDDEIPTSYDDFEDMPGALFDALFEVCGDEVPEVPDFHSVEARVDPKVRTGSSARSGSSAKAKSSTRASS